MTARKGTEKTTPFAAQLVQIDRICDEFEARWRAGERPEIEEYLVRVRFADRGKLLAELLEIELEMRAVGGEDSALDDYRNRFVDHLQVVESVYGRIAGRRRLGDYELLEELGRGGMGVVYRARQVLLSQIVALKVLPSQVLEKPEALARFKREMQSLGSLSHPNVVRAYNAGEADGVYFLVMEYVDGMDLHRLIRDRIKRGQGPLGVGAACEAVRQAALGLGHAHEQGLVHRDIKPANLMLSRKGEVRLLDLGLSKIRADREDQQRSEQSGPLTQAGTTLGTVDYMAPEQWESSSRVDIRADIYSLGCTLFFLLSGRPPYGDADHESIPKKLMAHAVEPPPSLAEVCPGCSPKLVRILGRMVAKKPDDRYTTPNELADAIGGLADPAALTECVTARERVDESAVASKPGIISGQIDTQVNPPTPLSKRPPASTSRSRRRILWRMIACGILLVAGLGIWAIWKSLQPAPNKEPRDGASGERPIPTAPSPATPKTVPTDGSIDDPVFKSPQAKEHYENALKMLAQREQNSVKEALEDLNKAKAFAPKSALVYTALADAYNLYGDYAWGKAADYFPMARDAAKTALGYNDKLAEAYLALAVATYTYYLDWDTADVLFQQALTLDSGSAAAHHWYAWFLLQRKGRDGLKEALTQIEVAHDLAQRDPIVLCNRGKIRYYGHDFPDAEAKYSEAKSVFSRFPKTRIDLALTYAELRKFKLARYELDKVGDGLADDNRDLNAARAYVFAMNGDAEARDLLAQLIGLANEKPLAYEIATIYSALGEKEKAFDWLETAFKEQSAWRAYIKIDPKLDGLRGDDRFRKFVGLANLKE